MTTSGDERCDVCGRDGLTSEQMSVEPGECRACHAKCLEANPAQDGMYCVPRCICGDDHDCRSLGCDPDCDACC